ncbi:endonuclease/exonuclease/phosphatase family protein [Roseibacterium sp. SDUM158017]|uniref:endonuclease/exonuclease/phosphatase family protein n=1 Tax=Roseicyclus salinarum TaxID=3036773 RepID=UPI002415036A|nr:endonuclease/exonuclease/phosphatase family protein [Roseibacterium sp. SDUM158017]MDG4650335.1 endonuclease/exonuclease/phosphatase family protein [Roseibacterium sp. SDUM158017]
MRARHGIDVRSSLAGACLALSCVALGGGLFAWAGPTGSALGPMARMLDAVAPGLAVAALGLGGLAALAGARRAGAVLALAALGTLAVQVAAYRDLSLPARPGLDPDLRVLFFNVEGDNGISGARILNAVLEASPDIVVLAEAAPLAPHLDALREAYDFVSDCGAEGCDLMVATRLEVLRFWRLRLNPAWPARYAVLEVETGDGAPVFFAASHLAKPWMSGIAEPEITRLAAQYDWLSGPALAVGDFNMTSWSRPMRGLLRETGFRALRGQPASWPAAAGRFGLPIDHVLVRDGVRVVRVAPFGAELGSNHRGFVAELRVAQRPG